MFRMKCGLFLFAVALLASDGVVWGQRAVSPQPPALKLPIDSAIMDDYAALPQRLLPGDSK